jgi:hypothetical protein
MSVATVRAAMAEALQTISSDGITLKATAYVTDQITPPQAMFDYELDPHYVFGDDKGGYLFTVWVFLNRGSEVASQKFLDVLRDPTNTESVPYVLENNAGLAAVVDFCKVVKCGRVEVSAGQNAEYLMVPFDVEVVF